MSTRGRVVAAALVCAMIRPAASQVPPPQPPAPGTDNATAPNPPGQIAPVGPRYSIELVVTQGNNPTYDNMHAQYGNGVDVGLQAVVRDATGQIVDKPENAQPPCHPVPFISDNFTPDGKSRGHLTGAPGAWGVHYDDGGGVFHVEMHCAEDPSITSDRTQAHLLNFENTSSIFGGEGRLQRPVQVGAAPGQAPPAPLPPPAMPAKAGGGGGGKLVLGAVLIGLALAGLIVAASAASSSDGGGGAGTTYCVVITSSTNGSCPPGNYPYATQQDCLSGPEGYPYLQSFCQCKVAQCGVTFGPNPCSPCASGREGPVRDVHDLVARGFARERAAAPVARTAASARATTASSGPSRWLVPAAAGALSIASLSYAMWRAARAEKPHIDLVPWATPNGAGLALDGRF